MLKNEWILKKTASLLSVRELRSNLNSILNSHNIAQQELQHWLLAFTEAATNIVRHTTPPATFIQLTLSYINNEWIMIIEDDGGETTVYNNKSNIPDILAEGGYGIALIQSLFAESVYSRTPENINKLVISNPLCSQVKLPTIILVDDDPVIRKIIQSYLKNKYQIIAFSSAEEAIPFIKKNKIDLILSDISMQGMDGLSMRKNLAGHIETDILPFVFITGNSSNDTRQIATRLGVDDYIVKPVKKVELLDIVSRVLQRSQNLKIRINQRLDPKVTAGLRPQLPKKIDGYNLVVQSRVASAGGGDYLLQHDKLILLGDIMGHGEQAKFFAYAHAGYFRGLIYGLYKNEGVNLLLNKLSQSMINDSLLSGALTTCIAAELNNEYIQLASAGHPKPWLITEKGIDILPVSGMLAGITEDTQYNQLTLQLKPKQRLMLYTDGLLESRSETLSSHYETEISHILLSSLTEPIELAAKKISHWFDITHAEMPEDDMTFVLIERPI
ncbi:MAG: SpoIIE family protein phosphatase [Plesiomonas sp.]|uniref:SpoIIE family protein phosphatase n=1 Tax=Plesiomonas sp. TaxID=2486279 RepID=UPI003F3EF381